ncbi:MAG: DegT/DnrJ/EryC1/StrS family aminotransferase [Candidatus Omnitrophota bacterium]
MAKNLSIPLLDLKREYAFLKKSIDRELKSCFAHQAWILGEKVTQFENQVAKYLDTKHAIGVASGTDALILSLRALAIKLKNKEYFDKNDEIITTPFTFVATAEAIVRSGATPVFVDINPNTFNIDPQEIKKAITKNTVGIIPVHLFGLACQMNEILSIARENNLFIVEDVAQAFGAEYRSEVRGQRTEDRKKLGTIGNCGAFSFFPSKNLGSYGDAGMVTTNDPKLAELIKVLRAHGQTKQYDAAYIGYNSRLDSMQAAILLAKLKYINKFNSIRIATAHKYYQALKGIKSIQLPPIFDVSGHRLPTSDLCLLSSGLQPLTSDVCPLSSGLQPLISDVCRLTSESSHVYNLYTIKVSSQVRDKLLSFLNTKGIGARVYYPVALHQMKAFKNAKIIGSLQNSEEATKQVISLPVHPFLKPQEIKLVIQTITEASQ